MPCRRTRKSDRERMSELAFKVVIPARYASTRLPGKPLLMLAGKPMLQYVYDRSVESGAADVIIATDDERIVQVNSACILGAA